jgi:hypothetical protein
MTTGASTNSPKSENNFCNQSTSHAAIVAPQYFAFVLDNATVGCFFTPPTNTTTSKRKHETTS